MVVPIFHLSKCFVLGGTPGNGPSLWLWRRPSLEGPFPWALEGVSLELCKGPSMKPWKGISLGPWRGPSLELWRCPSLEFWRSPSLGPWRCSSLGPWSLFRGPWRCPPSYKYVTMSFSTTEDIHRLEVDTTIFTPWSKPQRFPWMCSGRRPVGFRLNKRAR